MGREDFKDVDDGSAGALVEVSFVSLDRLTWSLICVTLGNINCGRADVNDNIIGKEHNEWPERSLITSEMRSLKISRGELTLYDCIRQIVFLELDSRWRHGWAPKRQCTHNTWCGGSPRSFFGSLLHILNMRHIGIKLCVSVLSQLDMSCTNFAASRHADQRQLDLDKTAIPST